MSSIVKLVAIAAVSAVSAVTAAQTVARLETSRSAPPQAAVAKVEPAPEAQSSAASITKSADGHFWAEADVNGRRVRFLVDTGASAVALTTEDARRLGIDPAGLDYDYGVQTASGQARAAKVTLDSISVAGAKVTEVEAFVIESGLESSLLGMTYLGRLSRFEATRTALILRP